ncbi:MAG: HlyD family efflux transporter periplasmic adaptor subunit [Eubacteriales bacterium]
MAKKNKKKGRIILFIILAIVALLVVGFRYKTKKASELTLGYEVTEVMQQDISTIVRGSGTVEAQDKIDVYATANIVISEVYVENGDEIVLGTPIAKIDKDAYLDAEKAMEDSIESIDNTISSMYSSKGSSAIYSTVKGTVKIVNVEAEQMIEAVMNNDDYLMVISADNNIKIEFEVDDTKGYEAGQKLTVKFDDKTQEATITQVDDLESNIKIVFEDNKYAVGQTADIYDEAGNKIGTGDMQINVPVYVKGDAGIARYVYVKENQSVSRGTKLLSIKENDASGELIDLANQREELVKQLENMKQELEDIGLGSDYIIYSTGVGIVDEFSLTPYMTVAEGMKIMTIQRTNPLIIKVAIDELDISKVQLGQIVDLKFEALDGEKYEGVVTKINSLGEAVNGVTNYTITVTIKETGSILIGMSGNAKIITEQKQDVLVVPIDAVQLINDEYYVILGKDANIKTVADHKIKTGINDGAYIEVLEGLEEGDTVAVEREQTLEFQMGPSR